MKRVKQSGFTLAEMMITMLIAAVLLGIAIPSYLSFIENNAILNASNQFATAVNYARMEAIRRGIPVGVCAAQSAAAASCGTANNWTNGWIVFLDADANNQVDSSANRLFITPALDPTLTVTANTNIVMYNSMGSLTSTPLNLLIDSTHCQGNGARTHTIPVSGQISIDQTAC